MAKIAAQYYVAHSSLEAVLLLRQFISLVIFPFDSFNLPFVSAPSNFLTSSVKQFHLEKNGLVHLKDGDFPFLSLVMTKKNLIDFVIPSLYTSFY